MLSVRETLNDNAITTIHKTVRWKKITRAFESSLLKHRFDSSQESKYCKLGHRLELVLVKNLMKATLNEECTHDVTDILKEGLAMKIGSN